MSRRDRIIFGRPTIKYENGYIKHFKGLDLEKIRTLLKEGLIDPNGSHSGTHAAWEYLEFMETYPESKWTVQGYVTSPDCRDCGVFIIGCQKKGLSDIRELADFVTLFYDADIFTIDEDFLFCWYD